MTNARNWLTGLVLLAALATCHEVLAQTTTTKPRSLQRASNHSAAARSASRVRKISHQAPPAKEPERSLLVESQPIESGIVDSDFAESSIVDSSIVGLPDAAAGDCCGDCVSACQTCCPGGWLQAEYLMWWPRPMQIPTLVTSGTEASEGVLGEAGTQTLLGDEMLNQLYSGVRLRLGMWTDPSHTYAWEADGFMIGEVTDSSTFSGTGAAGSGVIARPFFNVLTGTEAPNGQEDAELVAFPGQLSGSVTVEARSRMHGVGLHGMRTFGDTCGCGPALWGCGTVPTRSHFAGFVGWRYLDLDESLQINENLTSLLPSPDNGQFLLEDRFETDNTFHGVDLGVVWQAGQGPYSLDVLMRLALGSVRQNVSIAGSTTLRGSGGSGNNFEDATGGLLAQRTNIGDYSRNRFAVVPELGLNLGYAISPQWRATIGYTFMYWSSVARPGDQIDRDVNPNLLPPETTPFTGLARPAFAFVESDLWINGLSIGLERTW